MPRVAKKAQDTTANKLTEATKPKIKKPASAYLLFSKDIRPTVVKENPSLTGKEIIQAISARWKDLSDVEKKKYNDLYANAKKEYDELVKQNPIDQ